MCLQLYIYHLTYTFFFILFIHFIHLRIYVCMYVYNIYMYTFPCTHTHIRADIKYIPIRICHVISWFVWLADWLLLTYLFSVFPPGIRSPESPVRAQACSFARHRVLWGNFVWSQVFNICRAWSFSMDWFKAKFKNGHPYIWWENLWFPVDFPSNQSMEFLPVFLFFFHVDVWRFFQQLFALPALGSFGAAGWGCWGWNLGLGCWQECGFGMLHLVASCHEFLDFFWVYSKSFFSLKTLKRFWGFNLDISSDMVSVNFLMVQPGFQAVIRTRELWLSQLHNRARRVSTSA